MYSFIDLTREQSGREDSVNSEKTLERVTRSKSSILCIPHNSIALVWPITSRVHFRKMPAHGFPTDEALSDPKTVIP